MSTGFHITKKLQDGTRLYMTARATWVFPINIDSALVFSRDSDARHTILSRGISHEGLEIVPV